MRARGKLICATKLAIALVLVASPGLSQEFGEYSLFEPTDFPETTGANIHAGGLSVHPFIKFGIEYDDNIYTKPEDEVDDVIMSIGAGLTLDRESGDNRFQAGYELLALQHDENGDEDRIDHTLFANVHWGLAESFAIKLSEQFVKTSGEEDDAGIDLLDQINNVAGVGVSYDHNRLSFEVAYLNVIDKYDDLEESDRMDQQITLTGGYYVLPKTKVLLELARGWVDFDESVISDADYYQARIGVSGELTSKISGVAKVGYQSRDYDEDTPEDFDGLVAYVNLTAALSDRTKLVLDAERDLVASTFFDSAYYTSSSVGLTLEQKIFNKWTASLSAGYQEKDYPSDVTLQVGSATFWAFPFGFVDVPINQTDKRKDEILTAGAELTYHIRDWASLSLAYDYKNSDSNFRAFDYDDNRVSLTLSLTF